MKESLLAAVQCLSEIYIITVLFKFNAISNFKPQNQFIDSTKGQNNNYCSHQVTIFGLYS